MSRAPQTRLANFFAKINIPSHPIDVGGKKTAGKPNKNSANAKRPYNTVGSTAAPAVEEALTSRAAGCPNPKAKHKKKQRT